MDDLLQQLNRTRVRAGRAEVAELPTTPELADELAARLDRDAAWITLVSVARRCWDLDLIGWYQETHAGRAGLGFEPVLRRAPLAGLEHRHAPAAGLRAVIEPAPFWFGEFAARRPARL